MNSAHTLGGIFLTLSSLSSHLGQVSNAANVSMSIRKPFTRSNLERWMEDSLRTFLTCSFFSPWKGYLIENKPELTKVPNSTTFLPLFKAGTSPQHPPEVGAPRRQKGARASFCRRGVVGEALRQPQALQLLVLCLWLHSITWERDPADIIKVTNQLTLNSSQWRLCGRASANRRKLLKAKWFFFFFWFFFVFCFLFFPSWCQKRKGVRMEEGEGVDLRDALYC